MALLRELLIGIGFDVDSSDLEAAEGRVNQFKGFVTKLGAVVSGASAAISGMAYITGGMATELYNTASGLSLTTGELQKLHHAGNLAGVSADDMSSALESLNSSVLGVLEGNQSAITAFARFGVTVTDANGKIKDTDQILLELSDNFKKFPDGPQKAAIATDIFGGAGSRMFRFLNQGSAVIRQNGQEIEKWGGVLSNEGIQNALKFTDSLKRMWSFIKILYSNIAQSLLPIVTQVINQLSEWLVANQELLQNWISGALEILIKLISETWKWFGLLLGVIGKLLKGMESLSNVFGGFVQIMKTLITLVSLGAVGALTVFAVKAAAATAGLIALNGGLKATIVALTGMGIAALKAWAAMLGPAILIAAKFIAIGAAVSFVVLAIQDLWKWMTDPAANTFAKDLLGDFDAFKQKIVDVIDELNILPEFVEMWKEAWQANIGDFSFTDWMKNSWNAAIEYLFGGRLVDAAKDGLKAVKDWFVDSILAGFNAIVEWGQQKIDAIRQVIADLISDPIKTTKELATSYFVEAPKAAGGFIADKVASAFNFLKKTIAPQSGNIRSPRVARPPRPARTVTTTQAGVAPQVTVNVSAKTNASARDIGRQTAEQLTKVLTRQNFNANVAAQTAVEY